MFKRLSHFTVLIIAMQLIGAFMVGAYLAWHEKERRALTRTVEHEGKPAFVCYSSRPLLTSQLPLLGALRDKKLQILFSVNMKEWRAWEALQSLLLAGDGDLWIGGVERFAEARNKGAAVRLLALTGWKKYYLLSRDRRLKRLEDLAGKELPFTEPALPSVPIIQKLLKTKNVPAVKFAPYAPAQLLIALPEGAITTALVPEPWVSMLLEKDSRLAIVASIEEQFCAQLDCPGRLPMEGLAINANSFAGRGKAVEALLAALMAAGEEYRARPQRAVEMWRDGTRDDLPLTKAALLGSLQRSPVFVRPAYEVKDEIKSYLAVVAPDLRVNVDELVWTR